MSIVGPGELVLVKPAVRAAVVVCGDAGVPNPALLLPLPPGSYSSLIELVLTVGCYCLVSAVRL